MPTIHELSTWIRDYGRHARQLPRLMADRFAWHQLWAAMDVIDDVDSAMTAYLENDFPENVGEKYLRIYGAMQGLFLQQDALQDVINIIHPTGDIHVIDMLKDIREARNASVGHPTQLRRKGALSTHGIVQHSMNKDGFELMSYPAEQDGMFQHIPVRELIEKQQAEATRILSEVVEDLRKQEQAHRTQFREVKLMGVFDHVPYAFEKIFEGDGRGIPRDWAVNALRKSLDDFEKLLKERGLSVEAYASIKYLYEEIEHPLTELTKFIKDQASEIPSNKSAMVFARALRTLFDELRDIAREIDEEYISEPEPIVRSEPQVMVDLPIDFATTPKDS